MVRTPPFISVNFGFDEVACIRKTVILSDPPSNVMDRADALQLLRPIMEKYEPLGAICATYVSQHEPVYYILKQSGLLTSMCIPAVYRDHVHGDELPHEIVTTLLFSVRSEQPGADPRHR